MAAGPSSDDFAPVAPPAPLERCREKLAHAVLSVLEEEGAGGDGASFSRPFAQQLAALVWDWSTTSLAVDLEHFSRHAKRAGVSIEDVQLAARRNPQTKALIDAEARRLRLQRKSEKRGREAAG
ncbi:hypothetical protein EMIHUDRAFT_206955 [Emiliania huxleyi CCMP1516]|uniref:Centromere protein S n=3 Tax=Emiliania huxleyi TaxID=2903 RepID=A0A0D3JKB5_EMIH1|nr:hypothetical protein EMIHUDRAFT_206955 [Emiliania huxleyi CCMP1516]EOD23950.1 hypothetical protein EMIHUDRAFT_206955 [Emiliania huxleyi CCMP1516]|mmetsp:Transcript_18521/g.61204  ORF Transcript_18521/g.61204 Transcript_18521/m.61204 type:complete len:124 (-) Transcript_18521:263-634(-)|eukprot:XP_005776379.1 hypothetical protein EMIHUDRAFT_206955 [Emiliania huxleyi CCMP1516]